MKWIYTDNSGIRRRGTLLLTRGDYWHFRRDDQTTIDVISKEHLDKHKAHELRKDV